MPGQSELHSKTVSKQNYLSLPFPKRKILLLAEWSLEIPAFWRLRRRDLKCQPAMSTTLRFCSKHQNKIKQKYKVWGCSCVVHLPTTWGLDSDPGVEGECYHVIITNRTERITEVFHSFPVRWSVKHTCHGEVTSHKKLSISKTAITTPPSFMFQTSDS